MEPKCRYNTFGAAMPGRTYPLAGGYRYGFNGKEKDDEVKNISGSQYDYGMRVYDPRICKFLSVDPLFKEYPWYTPYQFAGNTPIEAIDLDGKEPDYIVDKNGKLTEPVVTLLNALLVYDKAMCNAVTITRNADPDNYAETWSATDVRTNPNSQSGGNNWLRTISHELKHVEQHFTSILPAYLDRVGMKAHEKGLSVTPQEIIARRRVGASNPVASAKYYSKKNIYEQGARDMGTIMDEFTTMFDVDKVLSNTTITSEEKDRQIKIMVHQFQISKHEDTILELMHKKRDSDTSQDDVTQSFYQEEINSEKKAIESHENKIKKLNRK